MLLCKKCRGTGAALQLLLMQPALLPEQDLLGFSQVFPYTSPVKGAKMALS